jgi:hypothetical protein
MTATPVSSSLAAVQSHARKVPRSVYEGARDTARDITRLELQKD